MEMGIVVDTRPYSAIWNASEISRRNFQWRYLLVAPIPTKK